MAGRIELMLTVDGPKSRWFFYLLFYGFNTSVWPKEKVNFSEFFFPKENNISNVFLYIGKGCCNSFELRTLKTIKF